MSALLPETLARSRAVLLAGGRPVTKRLAPHANSFAYELLASRAVARRSVAGSGRVLNTGPVEIKPYLIRIARVDRPASMDTHEERRLRIVALSMTS
jgi:hypothetical protein